MKLKIKICGLKDRQNLMEIVKLRPDYYGFIFYSKSERHMQNTLLPSDLSFVSGKKTGVFVNGNAEKILKDAREYGLDSVQLHGNGSPELCGKIKSENLEVIKAFSVDKDFDFKETRAYENVSDFFLFDTKGKKTGGNGFAFDWRSLEKYDQQKPFFLSGGIGPENIENIRSVQGMNLYGIDLNSKVEISPGIKDIDKIKEAIELLNQIEIKT